MTDTEHFLERALTIVLTIGFTLLLLNECSNNTEPKWYHKTYEPDTLPTQPQVSTKMESAPDMQLPK